MTSPKCDKLAPSLHDQTEEFCTFTLKFSLVFSISSILLLRQCDWICCFLIPETPKLTDLHQNSEFKKKIQNL